MGEGRFDAVPTPIFRQGEIRTAGDIDGWRPTRGGLRRETVYDGSLTVPGGVRGIVKVLYPRKKTPGMDQGATTLSKELGVVTLRDPVRAVHLGHGILTSPHHPEHEMTDLTIANTSDPNHRDVLDAQGPVSIEQALTILLGEERVRQLQASGEIPAGSFEVAFSIPTRGVLSPLHTL